MSGKRARILIVDDNETIHDDLKKVLETKKEVNRLEALKSELFGEEPASSIPQIKTIEYSIDDAFQGEEAIEMVDKAAAEDDPYALIFMDARMPPGMNGVKTIQEIWKKHPDIEMVLCTAYSDYTWHKILEEFGTTDHLLFIKKPFDSVAIRQLTLSLTTKWNLARSNKRYVANLESEVEKRTVKLNALVEQLSDEINQRKEKEKQLSILANYDSLTGLGNRFHFYKAIEKTIERISGIENEKFALLFIDIDFFKQVNDLLGHDIGDLLLIQITERLKSSFQGKTLDLLKISFENNDDKYSSTVFRLGGDEFTTLVKFESVDQVVALANRTIAEIKRPYFISNKEIIISCSIGISIFPDDSDNQAELVKYADIAMYQAKESKGCSVLFDKIRDNEFLSKLALEEELKKALLNEQLVLNYQALMGQNHEIVGIEALIRWDHPRLGILLPNDFIPIAEKYHHMVEIGEYILRTACRHLKEIHNKGFNDLFIFVNCTNKQFYDPGFIEMIESVLENSDLEPRFLKLGLEEEFSIKEPEKSLTIIKSLKDKGIQFGIDGFGKGKSILSFLSQVPEDSLIKIDRSYVSNLEGHPNNVEFLHSILDLIKSRHLNAIVSGIETEQQKDIISSKQCIVQGYYFNRPKEFNEFLEDITTLTSASSS